LAERRETLLREKDLQLYYSLFELLLQRNVQRKDGQIVFFEKEAVNPQAMYALVAFFKTSGKSVQRVIAQDVFNLVISCPSANCLALQLGEHQFFLLDMIYKEFSTQPLFQDKELLQSGFLVLQTLVTQALMQQADGYVFFNRTMLWGELASQQREAERLRLASFVQTVTLQFFRYLIKCLEMIPLRSCFWKNIRAIWSSLLGTLPLFSGWLPKLFVEPINFAFYNSFDIRLYLARNAHASLT